MTEADQTFTYSALPVEQQPGAPKMYLLGVDAAELLEWADVPNAKADYMAGYQRVYSQERATSISEFLGSSPQNIIPGAIIVMVSADSFEVGAGKGPHHEIHVKTHTASFEERLSQTYEHFVDRLSDAEKASVSISMDEAEAAAEAADDVEDSGIPDSYLAALTAELGQAIEDMKSLPPDRQNAIRNYIESISKPGLIIDGQHRVFGAKDVAANPVYLPVVLLPGLEVAEQVFHFYVLNNKAKPLSPTELRRTISTSLTNQEIDGLWQRFEDAGVNPEATRWTHKINSDPASPFEDLIDFGLGAGGFIKENVAYQLVSKFVNMPRKYRLLYKDIPAFQQKSDERLSYFYTFWNAIKDRYPVVWNDGVAAQRSQLFMKASMLVLQEYILDQLVQITTIMQMQKKPTPMLDHEELHDTVIAILEYLPPAFFSMEWQHKQIDTAPGRLFLRNQIGTAVQNQGKFLGNQQLFKKS